MNKQMDYKRHNINPRRSLRLRRLNPIYDETDLQSLTVIKNKKKLPKKSPSTTFENHVVVKINKMDHMSTCPGEMLRTINDDEKQQITTNLHCKCQVEGCDFDTITGLCGQHAIKASKIEKLIFNICKEIRQMENISNVMNFVHTIILLHFQFYFNLYLKLRYKGSMRYPPHIMEHVIDCRRLLWDYVITNLDDNTFTITVPFNSNTMCVNEEYNAGIVCNITWNFDEENGIIYDNENYVYSKEDNNFENTIPGLWFNCVYNSVLKVQKC